MKMIQALQELSNDFDYIFGNGEFTIEIDKHKFTRLLYEMRDQPQESKGFHVITFYFQGGVITVKRKPERKNVEFVWVDENPGLTIEQLKAALLPATLTGITCSDGRTDSHEPELRGDGWVICKKCGFGCLP